MTEERKEKDCCCETKEEVRHIVTEDRRRGEKRIKETCDEKVTEVFLEPFKLELSQRVYEQKCPVVCRRETETFDSNGNVVDKVVEDLAEEHQLRMVDHIVARPTEPQPEPEFVTKDEFVSLTNDIKGAVDALGEVINKPVVKTKKMVSAQNLLEDNVKNVDKETWVNGTFLAVFVLEVLALGYVIFYM